jgi:hypothetical protein
MNQLNLDYPLKLTAIISQYIMTLKYQVKYEISEAKNVSIEVSIYKFYITCNFMQRDNKTEIYVWSKKTHGKFIILEVKFMPKSHCPDLAPRLAPDLKIGVDRDSVWVSRSNVWTGRG